MKQTVIRTGQTSGYSDLEKCLNNGYTVKHITPIGVQLEYILEKQE